MTAAPNLYRRFGQFALPLAETQPSDLSSLDPARDILLELFAAALLVELTPGWQSATSDSALMGTTPVMQKLPSMPTPEALGEMKQGWPLLCVARAPTPGAQFADFTIDVRSVTQRWDVDYILCPLSIGNLLRVQDILQAVGKTIDLVIENAGHPAYRTVQSGNVALSANVLGSGPNCCGFWRCAVTEMGLGPASFTPNGPKYYACSLTLETIELSGFATDGDGQPDDGIAVPLEGADAEFGLSESGVPSILARG